MLDSIVIHPTIVINKNHIKRFDNINIYIYIYIYILLQACITDFDCKNNCVCNLGFCSFYYSLNNNISANNSKACLYGYVNT